MTHIKQFIYDNEELDKLRCCACLNQLQQCGAYEVIEFDSNVGTILCQTCKNNNIKPSQALGLKNNGTLMVIPIPKPPKPKPEPTNEEQGNTEPDSQTITDDSKKKAEEPEESDTEQEEQETPEST